MISHILYLLTFKKIPIRNIGFRTISYAQSFRKLSPKNIDLWPVCLDAPTVNWICAVLFLRESDGWTSCSEIWKHYRGTHQRQEKMATAMAWFEFCWNNYGATEQSVAQLFIFESKSCWFCWCLHKTNPQEATFPKEHTIMTKKFQLSEISLKALFWTIKFCRFL